MMGGKGSASMVLSMLGCASAGLDGPCGCTIGRAPCNGSGCGRGWNQSAGGWGGGRVGGSGRLCLASSFIQYLQIAIMYAESCFLLLGGGLVLRIVRVSSLGPRSAEKCLAKVSLR